MTIPENIIRIWDEAFSGCEKLTLYGVSGSYAETYAKNHNIPFVAGEAPSAPAATEPSPAVISGDGKVTSEDSLAILKVALGMQ